MLLIIIWYFFHNYFWPRPRPGLHSPDLGLGLEASASASASRFTDSSRTEQFGKCAVVGQTISRLVHDKKQEDVGILLTFSLTGLMD